MLRSFSSYTMNYDSFRQAANEEHIQAFAIAERFGGRELAYNVMDFNTTDHKRDLVEGLNKLSCVVDEEAGGIIAYAIGDENAVVIAQALLHYRKHLETIKGMDAQFKAVMNPQAHRGPALYGKRGAPMLDSNGDALHFGDMVALPEPEPMLDGSDAWPYKGFTTRIRAVHANDIHLLLDAHDGCYAVEPQRVTLVK